MKWFSRPGTILSGLTTIGFPWVTFVRKPVAKAVVHTQVVRELGCVLGIDLYIVVAKIAAPSLTRPWAITNVDGNFYWIG